MKSCHLSTKNKNISLCKVYFAKVGMFFLYICIHSQLFLYLCKRFETSFKEQDRIIKL